MICVAGINLHKSFADKGQTIEVLKDANLEVKMGDLVCITGKSGCGKSTLLHILGLLDDPDSGQVRILDAEVSSRLPQAHLIRNRDIGFVFQFRNPDRPDGCWPRNTSLPRRKRLHA